MLRISLGALVHIMVANDYDFLIKRSKNTDESIIKFIGPSNVKKEQYRMAKIPAMIDDMVKDKNLTYGGNLLLHYDVQTQTVIGCVPSLFSVLLEQKTKSKTLQTVTV